MQISMTRQQAGELGRIADAVGVDATVTVAWRLGGALAVTVTPDDARSSQDCDRYMIPKHGIAAHGP